MRFHTVGCFHFLIILYLFSFGFHKYFGRISMYSFWLLFSAFHLVHLTKKQNNSTNGMKPKKIFIRCWFEQFFCQLLEFVVLFGTAFAAVINLFLSQYLNHFHHTTDVFILVSLSWRGTFLRDYFNAMNDESSYGNGQHSPSKLFGFLKVSKNENLLWTAEQELMYEWLIRIGFAHASSIPHRNEWIKLNQNKVQ